MAYEMSGPYVLSNRRYSSSPHKPGLYYQIKIQMLKIINNIIFRDLPKSIAEYFG